MGRKYIIEIIGGEEGDMDFSTIEPYTEPNLEQVRKEAYEQGRKVGIKDGMCEAWETAKKVTYVSKYGGYGDCLDKVFDRHDGDAWDVFDYSPTEAIEKIRQYEKEKEMDGLRQNIQTIVDECGYSLDEIAEVLQKMKKS